jgi:hypothetical protein
MRVAWLIGMVVVAACGEEVSPIIDAAADADDGDGGVDEDAMAIDAPAIDTPAIDGSVFDTPVIDAAEIDAPAIDAAPIDAAPIDAAEIDAPAIDAPAIDAPAIDAPAIDAPAIDAPPLAQGCADGTREGFLDPGTFPAIAACAGTWAGDVANAAPVCAAGWHVCRGPELPLRAVTYAQATAFAGCFAVDAAQDNWMCSAGCSAAVAAGVDTAANIDLGGVGASCPYQLPGTTACFTGGRIDVSENSGTGCNFAPGITTGVVCCAGASPA